MRGTSGRPEYINEPRRLLPWQEINGHIIQYFRFKYLF
jgi:hypothetical protein